MNMTTPYQQPHSPSHTHCCWTFERNLNVGIVPFQNCRWKGKGVRRGGRDKEGEGKGGGA